MPVASSSRITRRHRRAPSSDIEEDGPSQARATGMNAREEDDVEMDDEEEVRPRRSKKGKKKRTQQDDSDAEGVEEEHEDLPAPKIDNQPVSKAQAKKLQGFIEDWVSMRDSVHKPGYRFVREVAASVAEVAEGEKGDKVRGVCATMCRNYS